MNEDIINTIRKSREFNNSNWMELLKLALEKAPEEAKAILVRINMRDREISRLLTKLAES